MATQVIVNQAGPLPITATFSAPGDEPMYLEVNGSVWTGAANNMIGIGIDLDGKNVVSMCIQVPPPFGTRPVPVLAPIAGRIVEVTNLSSRLLVLIVRAAGVADRSLSCCRSCPERAECRHWFELPSCRQAELPSSCYPSSPSHKGNCHQMSNTSSCRWRRGFPGSNHTET